MPFELNYCAVEVCEIHTSTGRGPSEGLGVNCQDIVPAIRLEEAELLRLSDQGWHHTRRCSGRRDFHGGSSGTS